MGQKKCPVEKKEPDLRNIRNIDRKLWSLECCHIELTRKGAEWTLVNPIRKEEPMVDKIMGWKDLLSEIQRLEAKGNVKPGHTAALVQFGLFAFACGCSIEMEPQRKNGKLIFRYGTPANKGERFFAIESTNGGIWVHFYDPKDNLSPASDLARLKAKKDPSPRQYNKYGMNLIVKFEPGSSEIMDCLKLIENCVCAKRDSPDFSKRKK